MIYLLSSALVYCIVVIVVLKRRNEAMRKDFLNTYKQLSYAALSCREQYACQEAVNKWLREHNEYFWTSHLDPLIYHEHSRNKRTR